MKKRGCGSRSESLLSSAATGAMLPGVLETLFMKDICIIARSRRGEEGRTYLEGTGLIARWAAITFRVR